MAISSSSKRIQLTLNGNKEHERLIMNYLSASFNENNEIKRILYEYVVNQSSTKRGRKSKSKTKLVADNSLESKLLKGTKSKSKIVKKSNSDKKLLTVTDNDTKVIKSSDGNSEIVKGANNDIKVMQEIDSKSTPVKDAKNDDFALNLNNFEDKVVEVKSTNNEDKELEQIKQNELNELSKFM